MNVRAFVIGNAAWDETLHLAALPEPGASVHVRRGVEGPGGKGVNQAVVLARAGLDVTFLAAVGQDPRGDALSAALACEGLAGALTRLSGVATDCSAILLAEDGRNAVLTTRAAAEAVDPEAVVAALAQARRGDLCLLQGNLSLETTRAAVVAAGAQGMFVALNPSPAHLEFAALFAQVDALFLNRDEAQAFAGSVGTETVASLGATQVVLTLGAEGARLISLAGARSVLAAPACALDPTGAGDTFLAAALAHAAPRGWVLDGAALEAGARAAALTIARPGAFAALPTRAELAEIIAW